MKLRIILLSVPLFFLAFKGASCPTVYTVSGGGTFCDWSYPSVYLSNSQFNVTYYLYKDGSPYGTPKFGSTQGGPLEWTGIAYSGVYTVRTSNMTGCGITSMAGSATFTFNHPPEMYLFVDESTICNGQTTYLRATVTGGLAPFTINISGYGTVSNYYSGQPIPISPSANANYNATSITDSYGCSRNVNSPRSVTVNNGPSSAILSLASGSSSQLCTGQSSNLVVNISGGTGPFSFSIAGYGAVSNYSSGTPISVSPTSTTSYSISGQVTGSNGCAVSGSGSATMTINPITSATLVGSTEICNGSSTSLSINISGGTPPYTFTIDNGIGLISGYTSGAPINVAPTANTTYSVVGNITDSNGCTGTATGTAAISVNAPPISAVLSGTTYIVQGASAPISVDVSGGTPPYSFTIDNGVGLIIGYSSQNSIMVSPFNPTAYSILGNVTDAKGCVVAGSGNAVINILSPDEGLIPDIYEFQALKDLYDSLGGANWTTKTNWPTTGNWPASATSVEMGTWYGITVTNGDITKIDLNHNNLIGQLPSSISNFSALKELRLFNNKLSGTIPQSIGMLDNILEIHLFTNLLTGELPSTIGQLGTLRVLWINGNKLSGQIPQSLNQATELRSLSLSQNLFTGPMTDLSGLTNLQALNLNSVPLDPGGIPNWISNLHYLKTLNLGGSNRTGVIPDFLGNMSSLTDLLLHQNQLTGSIPYSLGNLTNLVQLYLASNQLTGEIPSSIGNLINLTYLVLNNNQLSGSIPNSVGNMIKLQNLYLQVNKLSGIIPDSMGNLVNLVNLYLYSNQLSGSLPATLGALSKLKYFYASNNKLTGEIPSTFSGLSELYLFYVNGNRLNGVFPDCIGNWTKLNLLSINGNQFSGAFPSSVSNCTSLSYFRADYNKFTSLPVSLLSMPSIDPNFDNNELSAIPDFSAHINKGSLDLRLVNNKLDFSQLEPLIGSGMASLAISPQKEINDVSFVSIAGNLTIPSRPITPNTTITWEKQSGTTWINVDASNEDPTKQTFYKANTTTADEGVYRWKMTNSVVTGFTLQSAPITVRTAQEFALDNWAFQYKYDSRKRMTHKKVPGADWVYMVYDNRDRLVMTQDGEQRKLNKWTFTKYDKLNRPVMTGIYTHTTTLDQAGMSALISTTQFAEDFDGVTALTHGYTNIVFPTGELTGSKLEPLTITYYDNYNYLNGNELYAYRQNQVSDRIVNETTYSQPESPFYQIRGKVTGRDVRTLGSLNLWEKQVYYYDEKYNAIQTLSEDHRGNVEITTQLFDFTRKVISQQTAIESTTASWQNIVGVVTEGNDKLVRLSGTGWDAGASSVETLAANQDGWIEVTAPMTNTNQIIGLSASDVNQDKNSINFAIYFQQPNYYVYENGLAKKTIYVGGGANPLPQGVNPGDFFRIERKAGVIRYYWNNSLIYTSLTNSTSSLVVDASLMNINSSLLNIRTSFSRGIVSSISRTFDYDHAGRLVNTWHQVDGGDQILLAHNEYNELGQLVDKRLHSEDGTTYKQSVDYRYNIRGWLTSINNAELANDGLTNDDSGDFYGMNLLYNQADTELGNTSLYNGNISSIKWSANQGLGDVKKHAYNYQYDPLNRIKAAAFQKNNGSWSQVNDFSVSDFDYDLNGNIQQLTRRNASGGDMDLLAYSYGSGDQQGNQLRWVADAGDKTQGFVDGNVSGDDYLYDANGNMTSDKNKNITAITYNYLNLPEKVTKGTGEYIKYIYDAGGRKLSQQVYASNNTLTKSTDYVGEYIYENDTVRFMNTEEGRVMINSFESSLLASYGLDGDMIDNSGNGYNGTVVGAVIDLNHKGEVGGLKMDGNDDYGMLPDNDVFDFGLKDFTISIWVKKLAASSNWDNNIAVNKWNTGSTPGSNSWSLGCGVQNADTPGFNIESGTIRYQAVSNDAISLNQWHHIVGVRGGDKIRLFVDGVQKTETFVGTASINNTTLPMYIGKIPQGLNTKAVYDDLKIYGEALDAEDIQKMYEDKFSTFEYQYHLKDHLGNVRVTFTTKDEQENNMATLETENETEERAQFLYYDDVRLVNSTLFDHTGTGATHNALRLNGSSNERIGLAKSLAVVPGDKVQLEVYGKYIDVDDPNLPAALTALLAEIASSPPGTITGNVIDGGGYAGGGTNAFPFAGALGKENETGTSPKAYLNYLVFNKDYIPQLSKSGFKRLGAGTYDPKEDGTGVPHEKLEWEIDITEAGYVYIWLSNEEVELGGEPVEVYFDDFKVTHIKSPVVQSDEYYPFGLAFNSYQRENSTKNNYLYNGKELQDELDLGWLHYGARMYMPEIGKWFSIDPKAEEYDAWSPYHYVYNNPVKLLDPDGREIINGAKQGTKEYEATESALSILQKTNPEAYNTLQNSSIKYNITYAQLNPDEAYQSGYSGDFTKGYTDVTFSAKKGLGATNIQKDKNGDITGADFERYLTLDEQEASRADGKDPSGVKKTISEGEAGEFVAISGNVEIRLDGSLLKRGMKELTSILGHEFGHAAFTDQNKALAYLWSLIGSPDAKGHDKNNPSGKRAAEEESKTRSGYGKAKKKDDDK